MTPRRDGARRTEHVLRALCCVLSALLLSGPALAQVGHDPARSPYRDIAGMLRSFDYAGGSVEHDRPGSSARRWVDNGVAAFLEGYATQGPDPRERLDLLRAFLLDKALYEVVYEARNRPTWLAIPVAAITRLLEHPEEHDEERGASS